MTNILYLIDENYASFSKNEKKLSRFILNSPHKVISMSNQEIAKELEMSVSTLNRYSQKLINQSFHEVRSQLAMLFPKQQAPYKIELLNNFKRANNIFIFGYGASYVCATDLYQKLSRIGLNVQLVQETHLFTTMLSTHDKEDCVLFITNNGDQSELRAMVKVVSDYNIPIITISSSEHNHVAQHSDIVLTYGHSDENELRMGATTSLFAQMFTIDVLFYRYIALNYESSLDFITQSKMALDNYRKYLSNVEFKH